MVAQERKQHWHYRMQDTLLPATEKAELWWFPKS